MRASLLGLFATGARGDFATTVHSWRTRDDISLGEWSGVEAIADVVGTSGRKMYMLPQLLTADEIAALHSAAIECGAYDTAEADTVDKAPTFQANIFEDGEVAAAATVAGLLKPIVAERLLPYVRAKFSCPDACVGDALLRRYRAGERMSLNLHYDIQAFATAIIPLSVQRQPAGAHEGAAAPHSPPSGGLSAYTGGLFVQGGASRSSRRLVRFESAGDVLVHQFDLMHGVDVQGGDRYAVAVWFYDSPDSRARGTAPWVLAAAEGGNADAQFLQATFCAQGRFGNQQDDEVAAEWLERGAAQGHATSELGLARHLLGAGEEERAAGYFRRAAEQGHVEAQYSLALCHLDGMGVPPDRIAAAEWFGRAAEEGGEFGEAAEMELTEMAR